MSTNELTYLDKIKIAAANCKKISKGGHGSKST